MTDLPPDSPPPDDTTAQQETDGRDGKGRGSSGGGGGGPPKLSIDQLKDVTAAWKKLELPDAVARIAEFFNEQPARASSNVFVDWASPNRNGYAVVNHLLVSGLEINQFMRERTAGQIRRLHTKYGVKVIKRPSPRDPNPQPPQPAHG